MFRFFSLSAITDKTNIEKESQQTNYHQSISRREILRIIDEQNQPNWTGHEGLNWSESVAIASSKWERQRDKISGLASNKYW